MMTTPRELLETSIAQLQMLKAFLTEQLGERGDESESLTPDVAACQEILVSLGELILKVQCTRRPARGRRGVHSFQEVRRIAAG